MLIFNDTAILKTQTGFIRPSDLVGKEPTQLLTVTSTGKERYATFTVKEVQSTCARFRVTHGAILDLGYGNVMVGAINTGYEGCVPKMTFDMVLDVKQGFKYIEHTPSDFYSIGKDTYYIDLEEFTDKKSGTYNIANKDFYKFLGWASRTGSLLRDIYTVAVTPKYNSIYADLYRSLPLDLIEIAESPTRIRYKFRRNWFIDVILGLCGERKERFLADDIVFHCTTELAESFREGFINCNCMRPNSKWPDILRYDCMFGPDKVSDLCFVIRKSKHPIMLISDSASSFRLTETTPRYAHYVQEITHTKVPKTMYEIIPMRDRSISPLWVSGMIFQTI